MSKCGATIQELNTVRKQLSLLKGLTKFRIFFVKTIFFFLGGGLAKLAFPARVVSLILSDVVGDPLDIIASGPTVFCHENPKEAVKVSYVDLN